MEAIRGMMRKKHPVRYVLGNLLKASGSGEDQAQVEFHTTKHSTKTGLLRGFRLEGRYVFIQRTSVALQGEQ